VRAIPGTGEMAAARRDKALLSDSSEEVKGTYRSTNRWMFEL